MKNQRQIASRGNAILMGLMLSWAVSSAAFAGEWTEGTLGFIHGMNQEGNSRSAPLAQVELMMKGGKTFTADPRLTIVDQSGHVTTIDRVSVPAKVRFRADGNVIRELKVVETLPR